MSELISLVSIYLMDKYWSLLALLSILVYITKIFIHKRKRKPPPGPKPWPVIGNLNLVAGTIPHQSLHSLSQIYGQIMQLKFGSFPVVVASSPEMAKHFLKIHDAVFAFRPPLAASNYTSFNHSDMVFAPYGPFFKQARKLFLSHLFTPKRLEFFHHIRAEERLSLLSRLHSLSGRPVVLKHHLLQLTLSTITRIAFGNKYCSERGEDKESIFEREELQGYVNEWFFLNGAINLGDWIPWLSFLDLQGYIKRMRELQKNLGEFYDYVIDDHLATRATKKEHLDMVDVLLQQAEDPSLEVPLTRDRIKGLLHDLLVGGTDTSATTVEWAIYELLRRPRIMKKAKEELDRVIGRERWVEEEDFSQLPYIDCIIMETFRLHPLATLLAPHYANEDCNVAGYDIAKGTMIMINTWSIGRDPNSWDAPLEFLPERFMGKQVDMLGSNFALLPFGSGRRRCPGYKLGLKIVRTTLANLVHGFEMKLEEGMKGQDICMEEEYGLTTHPKHPLSIIMEPTLPPHLY